MRVSGQNFLFHQLSSGGALLSSNTTRGKSPNINLCQLILFKANYKKIDHYVNYVLNQLVQVQSQY